MKMKSSVKITAAAVLIAAACLTASSGRASVLAFWNFNGTFDTNNPAPFEGTGTSAAVNCDPFLQPNMDALDTTGGGTNTAWGTQNYPAQGESNKLSGAQFNVSTAGSKNITVSYDTRGTTTASEFERLQYTTNGTDFIDFPASSSFSSAAIYESRSFSLAGFPGVRDNPNFAIRVVTEFQSTATYGASNNTNYVPISAAQYGTSGTVSYDLVTISGDDITDANTPPTVSTATNRTTGDTMAVTVNFQIGDVETPAGSLTFSATSLNQAVLQDSAFSYGGSGTNRTLMITPTPGIDGVVPILVTVTDEEGDTGVSWFYLTINPVNLPPTISALPATNTLINTPITIPFKVADDRTAPGSLVVGGSSGNQMLLPNSGVTFGGSGSNRTITLTPAAGQLGVAPITVTVNDNDSFQPQTTTVHFTLVVRPDTNVVMNDFFDYDTGGAIISISGGFWQSHSGIAGQMQAGGGIVTVDGVDNTEDVNAQLIGQPYMTNSGAVLYSSFMVNLSELPLNNGTYFAHFKDNTISGFLARVFASTSNAAPGSFRFGIGNSTGATGSTAQIQQDLGLGTNYFVVTRLVMSNGFSTVWVNPTSESSPGATDTTAVTNLVNIYAYALRESSGEGIENLSNLKVGLTFDSVAPPPTLSIQVNGGNAVVTWPDFAFGLQSATDVTGPWADVSGATSPYTNGISGSMYFRLKK